MTWSSDFNGMLEQDVPLADMTWYKLGGNARWVATPGSIDELSAVCRRASKGGIAVRTLGRGANVLVRDDGFDGVVIRLDAGCFKAVRYDGPIVHAGGGVDLMELAHQTARFGLAGLDVLAGIPGSVGGAIRMNAGGRFGRISDVVIEATIMDLQGEQRTLSNDELQFGYRTSAVGRNIVVSATLELREEDPKDTLARFHQVWRLKKESQPMADKSAGCIFKNPNGYAAGALIDQAGLKGTRVGNAKISERHANFIVAKRDARSRDILELIDIARTRVREQFGVDLELEIDVW